LWSRTGHRWQYNMAHAHFVLGTKGYRQKLRIYNTYCFPLQQWLREHASILRHTHIACPVLNCNSASDNLFAYLCSWPLPVFHCSITAQKKCLLPQPYSGNRFGSVKFSARAEVLCCAEQWAFGLLRFVSFAVFPWRNAVARKCVRIKNAK